MTALVIIHTLAAVGLATFGLNLLILALLFLRHGDTPVPRADVPWDELPAVVVQVPVYNELHVVERVVDAVAALDYPRDRLEIQILDDSTDATTSLAETRAANHRNRGVFVDVLRRPSRAGFKAGALAWGLERSRAEYVAIFDADFQPRPDFLLKTVPLLQSRPHVGMVQTRWSSLNASHSWLTRAEALIVDGHFAVEQVARSHSGLLVSNNGSGGVWRRACIQDSGGWSATTLCEDLDLSFRAQLAGWDCTYAPAVDVPGEVPPQIAAFKRQQARWAQGSMQCLRKLAPAVLVSRILNRRQKVMALLHLGGYASHPAMILLLIMSLPMLLVPRSTEIPLGGLGLVYLGAPLAYALSQRYLYRNWLSRMQAFPMLALVGIGIAWNNAKAVVRGLSTWGGRFERTPKFRLEGPDDRWESSSYRLRADESTAGEIALAVYALVTAIAAVLTQRYAVVPFATLYAASFATVAGLELAQRRSERRTRTSATERVGARATAQVPD